MKKPARFVTVLYIIVGILWILFSDNLVLLFLDDPQQITRIQTYKGWFFVLGSGLLIFVLLSILLRDLTKAQKHLQKSENLTEEFFRKHHQPLWKANLQGFCTFTNEKWIEFTGHKIDCTKPFAWLDNVHPHDKPHCIDKFTYGFIDKKEFELEYRILTINNTYHWVHNSCIPQYDTNGKIEFFVGYIFDIQEKKQLQERYKESSRRYGYLFANNPQPMFVYDTQDLRILEANKAALSLYGYEEREFLTMNIIDLRPPSEIPLLMEHISEGLPEYHRSSGWVHKKKNGELIDVEVSGHALPIQNNRSMRIVMVRDITEQLKVFRSAKDGERRFKAIFNHSEQGAMVCNVNLKIEEINSAACRILDSTRETALSMSLPDLMDAEEDPIIMHFTQVLKEGKPVSGEANMKRFGGSKFRASFHGIGFTENGELKVYFSFANIDEKHKMQIALEESERLNATLVTNLPGMVYRCLNDEAWTMILVSYGVEKLTGYTEKQILYNKEITYNEIIFPEDRQNVREAVEKALSHGSSFDILYRIRTRQGKIKWVREQARGIHDMNDTLIYVEGFIVDITREREALQQVEFQSAFLEMIMDNIPFPLFCKDVEGIYTGCNKAFCEYLGKKKKEIIGHSVFDLFDKEQAEFFHQKDMALLENRSSQIFETEITFSNGRKMNALFHKSVFYDVQKEPMGIIGIYFDITQRIQAEGVIKKQLEELGRINSELERFSYTVSHDLRSPLVTIKGFLGLLRDDLQEQNQEQVDEDIMRIENATDKMHQLLEDLLKLSRIGRVAEQNETFSMTNVAQEARELLYGLLKDKKCEIFIQPNMPQVVAVRARIRELYQNLLENAVKFTCHLQNPLIKVFCKEENGEVVFCVQDNGIGIDQKYHAKIFGLFDKLDAKSPGTGLGLSLVKRIVEYHHGRIWVESEGKNNGSVFCFTLNTEKVDMEKT